MKCSVLVIAILLPLAGCTHFPWDYTAQNSRIAACYHGGTPDDVTACLGREDIEDPVYPVAFKPGNGAFCSPDLDHKECRESLENANAPTLPVH